MEMKILEFINMAANNKVIELVVLAIVFDTIFGPALLFNDVLLLLQHL